MAVVTSYRKVMSMHVKLHQKREEQKAPAFGKTRLRKRLTVVVDGSKNGWTKEVELEITRVNGRGNGEPRTM